VWDFTAEACKVCMTVSQRVPYSAVQARPRLRREIAESKPRMNSRISKVPVEDFGVGLSYIVDF